MKLLRRAAFAALTVYGGIFASAGNAAPAAALLTGAPTVRTLATPAPNASVEKTYYYRRYYWHRYHYRRPYYHRSHRWHRWHRWHRYYW
jgi:hypothetical protein